MVGLPRTGLPVLSLFLVVIFALPLQAQSPPEGQSPPEYSDFSELDLESLLSQTVVTASKYKQKLNEIPVTATVITAEEIAASGARTIPEVLYGVPGLDVMQTTSSAFAVSARGMNKPGSNNMLVLVDGRSVYLDFYGLTIWNQLTVNVEDIKSIEVILGPGSAMYGANAFAGVINIITFSPEEKSGRTARTMVTNLGEGYVSGRVAQAHGNSSYKVNVSWDKSSDWETDIPEGEVSRIGGQVNHKLSEQTELAVSGGHANGICRILPYDASVLADGQNSFFRVDARRGELEFRYFMNHWDYIMQPVTDDMAVPGVDLASRMHDLELQYQFNFLDEHRILLGSSYRFRKTNYSETEGTQTEDIFAGFILEEWQPSDKFFASAGLRYEHHPLVKGHFSPRGGLVYKIHPQHSLRASYSRAYRNPSFLETYWSATFDLMPGMAQTIHGDLDNQSESMEAFELGYQGMVKKDLLFKAAIFHNNIDDLIQVVPISFFSPPLDMIPEDIALTNNESWQARGAELSFQGNLSTWLQLAGAYSYVWVENSETGEHQAQAPAHIGTLAATWQYSTGSHLRLKGRFRSEAEWVTSSNEMPGLAVAPEWVFWDVSWNYQLPRGSRLTLAVENILDKRVRHYPAAIEQQRRAKMSLTLDF